MKTAIQQGSGKRNPYPLAVRNNTGEEIPPHALLLMLNAPAANIDAVYQVGKPSPLASGPYILNGPSKILPNGYGAATADTPALAAYNAFEGVPSIGSSYGPNPLAPSWFISPLGNGYIVLGGDSTEDGVSTVRVAAANTGGSKNGDVPIIYIYNATGAPLANRSVVGIGAPITAPPSQLPSQPTFLSQPPSNNAAFAILLEPLAPGGIGEALTTGVLAVQIDLQHIAHVHARPVANNYTKLLSESDGPAKIIWREKQSIVGPATLGLQWAKVALTQREADHPTIRIYNSSPTIRLQRRSIVGLGDIAQPPLSDESLLYRRPVFESKSPYQSEPFAVTFDAIDPGDIGDAAIVGAIICKVDIIKQTHDFADANGQATNPYAQLKSEEDGPARILWKENPTQLGVMWCAVALNNSDGTRSGNTGGVGTGTIEGSIGPGSAASPTPGSAQIVGFNEGAAVAVGLRSILNPFPVTARGNCTCVRIYIDREEPENDKYLILGIVPEVCRDVVTNVQCIEGEIIVTTQGVRAFQEACGGANP